MNDIDLVKIGFDAIVKECPNLFWNVLEYREHYGKPKGSYPTQWDICSIGLRCNSGWVPLIHKTSVMIEKCLLRLPEETRKNYYVQQVKEKFGYLNFYINKPTRKPSEEEDFSGLTEAEILEKKSLEWTQDSVDECITCLVMASSLESGITCELCAEFGDDVKRTGMGYTQTLCSSCERKVSSKKAGLNV